MSKRIHPERFQPDGGEHNEAFTEESKANKSQNVVENNNDRKLQDVVDLQIKTNAAKDEWQNYVTRKRLNNIDKKHSTLSSPRRLGKHGSVPESELGLEIDPEILKKELSQDTINFSVGSLSPHPANGHNQHKLNRKLIEHFVMLNKSDHETAEIDLEYLKSLFDKGANINCTDRYGQTVLHETARIWHTDIASFLIKHGADVRKSDRYGRTPIHIAAATDYPEMIELLLQNGADIEAQTAGEKQTPLHFAARNDAVEACKVLAKCGAEFEAKDYRERTPVHVAAELDRSETARWLFENGANVGVCDDAGLSCMTHMITKMGPVARDALDTFHKMDRANRRQYFHLNLLEHDISADIGTATTDSKRGVHGTMAKTPLQVIVSYKQLEIIMHPVILKMLELKWLKFGRVGAIKLLLTNLVYILLWTALAVGVPWQTRYLYILPGTDIWRIVVWILAVGMTTYYIWIEINEILTSRRKFKRWKDWRIRNIGEDMKFCHPKWPEEMDYLKREIDNLDEMLPAYFQDFWNFFDWTVYFLNFAVLISDAVNIMAYTADNRPPPCCTIGDCETTAALIRAGNLTDKGSCAQPDAFVNNACLSVWVNRIFVINILMMWLRLMKNIRSFRTLGPFVVMLGKMTYDILRFLFLYFEFYIPYACAFWMIFGGEPSIESMSTVDQMLFSLYRITLVDDYQYDEMHTFDVVMTYFLVGTFLGVSAILCINLFIALLSDTFQRVYDNANSNAVMQQAIQILSIEENLNPKQKQEFRRLISRKCSPKEEFYDDDLTTSQDDSLKKATLQIRDQMDEVLEHIRIEQRERRDWDGERHEGRQTHHVDLDVQRPRSGISKLSSDLSLAVTTINKYQTRNERLLKKLQRDVKEIKLTLTQLGPDFDPTMFEREDERPVTLPPPASRFEPPLFPFQVRELVPIQRAHQRGPWIHQTMRQPAVNGMSGSALEQEDLVDRLTRSRSSQAGTVDFDLSGLTTNSEHLIPGSAASTSSV